MRDARAPLDRLLEETRAVIRDTPRLAAFADGALDGALPFAPPVPRGFPAVARLDAYLGIGNAATRPLTEAIIAAAPHLGWQQTYSAEEVGADFLAAYAWSNLVSPEGPFRTPDIRVAFGTWGHGLFYPRHAHAPAEIYYVIAGGALFETDGQPDAWLGPGETRMHKPHVMHAARMTDGPLLALALWRGEALMARSTLETATVP
ncbi:MAG: dimethylsulfonioproprionate lyase family protein [Pseudomonadota bacterium]